MTLDAQALTKKAIFWVDVLPYLDLVVEVGDSFDKRLTSEPGLSARHPRPYSLRSAIAPGQWQTPFSTTPDRAA